MPVGSCTFTRALTCTRVQSQYLRSPRGPLAERNSKSFEVARGETCSRVSWGRVLGASPSFVCVCVCVCESACASVCVCENECAGVRVRGNICGCAYVSVCVCVRAERQLMGGASPDQQTEGGLSSALSIVRRA